MADTVLAKDADRLPWLTDDVRRPRRTGGFVVPFLAASAVAVIAAFSFWIGMNGGLTPPPWGQAQPEARVELPPAVNSPSEPVPPEPESMMPQVEPAPVPPPVALPSREEVRMEVPPPVKRMAKNAAAAGKRARSEAPKTASSKTKDASAAKALNYTNPWKSKGVSGRMVRVGAYGSLEKGKDAWSRLSQLSPGIKTLPAVVTDIPSPNGRVLYWLQIGTTSQAHSEVLCQRMRAIGQRCVVVDVAGAQKGSGNDGQPAGVR